MRTNFFSVIKLSDMPAHDKAPIVQILRVTKFQHPQYGTVEITPAILQKFKENFDNKVRRQDIPIDYFHENEGVAAGWIKELFFSDTDCTELWARVDWTKNALQKLNEKELRYFSPEFAFQWTDPETGVSYDNVLFGGGLTNRPQVKDMAPIILEEFKGELDMDKIKELEAQVVTLGEQVAQGQAAVQDKAAMIADLEKKIADMQAQCDALKGENQNMLADNAAMKDKIACSEKAAAEAAKKAEFVKLLSEGKACAAQEAAYMANDMVEFANKAAKINLSENGNGTVVVETSTLEGDEKILELAEKMAKEEKISLIEAIVKVKKAQK